jgi:hypothetical protein
MRESKGTRELNLLFHREGEYNWWNIGCIALGLMG